MRLEKLRKFNRLVIGGHASVLSDADLNELRLLLGTGHQTVLNRMPTTAEMRCMAPCDCIVICADGLNMLYGHSKARRMTRGRARYVFRKLDEKYAIMVRLP